MRDQGPPTAGSAREVLNSATLLLRPDEVVFEAMLQGWTRQMSARNLAFSTTTNRVQTVRRFFARHHVYPWHWTPALVDEWVFDLRTMRRYSKASVRSAQVCLRGFCDYLIDPAYEWPDTCQALFGTAPMQILTEVNAAAHVADYEGEPAGGRSPAPSSPRCSTTSTSASPADRRGASRVGCRCSAILSCSRRHTGSALAATRPGCSTWSISRPTPTRPNSATTAS